MVKFLKDLFACKHKHTKSGFKSETRFDRPIIIDFKECLDCGRILRCKVSFAPAPVAPTVTRPPQHITLGTNNKDVITGTLNVAPTVHLSLDLTANPGQNRKEAEVPKKVIIVEQEKPVIKETPKVVVPPEPPVLRDADSIETELNTDKDDSPVSNTPDVIPPADGTLAEASDIDEDTPEQDTKGAMKEGACFLKESRASINSRRRALARRREKAMEQLKKTGKATVVVPKKSSIPSLTDPDAGDNRQSECT